MKAKTRRKLEMGLHALIFSRLHQSPAGVPLAVVQLEQLLHRARELAVEQRDGLVGVRAAADRKRELRRTIRRLHVAHLREVARAAEAELPELWQKFVLPRGTIPYQTFRPMVDRLAAEAERHREVLVTYGLADEVLQSLRQAMSDLDEALQEGRRARLMHVSAGVALDAAADRVVLLVRMVTPIYQLRFARNPGLLAAWETASHVIATPHSAPQDISPAA